VDALNQIDLLFYANSNVIDIWHRLYDSMQLREGESETDSHKKRWELLRFELFDSMAIDLGYTHLKQVSMMKHYYSKGQEQRDISEWEFRDSAVKYWQVGSDVYQRIMDFGLKYPWTMQIKIFRKNL